MPLLPFEHVVRGNLLSFCTLLRRRRGAQRFPKQSALNGPTPIIATAQSALFALHMPTQAQGGYLRR